MVGGRTNHWGRISLRFGPDDFRRNSLDGLGTDWPIGYDDLKPWYDEVDRLVGIFGSREGLPNHPDGIFHEPPAPRCYERVIMEAAKKQNKDVILAVIQRKCDEVNSNIEALGTIHLDTPNCTSRPVFVEMPFSEPEPAAPPPLKPSLLDKLFKKRMLLLQAKNAKIQTNFAAYYSDWSAERAKHIQQEQDRKRLIEEGIYARITDMEQWLEENLQDIYWPRETAISLELLEDGQLILIDVDLPEIEDMPSSTASVPSRGLKLSVKEMSATAIQKLYMAHVHAVAFRIIGEAFAALPKATTVVFSGYSQRPDKATGRITDVSRNGNERNTG